MSGRAESPETASRSVVLASADTALRWRLRESLAGMRWRVREAGGGAEAMAQLEEHRPEALMVDSWLPDLEVGEFAGQIRTLFPSVDVLRMDGGSFESELREGGVRSPRRHELLHALREAQEKPRGDSAAWQGAPVAVPSQPRGGSTPPVADRVKGPAQSAPAIARPGHAASEFAGSLATAIAEPGFPEEALAESAFAANAIAAPAISFAIPGMIGASASMLELARLIRLVAPRSTSVLIEGETGTGKEVVAKALHRLGSRSSKPFTVLNCAAIPESLLEAELFGHTRGAFTGAVQARTGRIEAAHGGTLFLDEIGEMPLALQAKMLRFLECGELQRVGDNDTMTVDVRVIAATHQHLVERSAEGTFRLDLYHRLAVFPLEIPALRDRREDIPALAEHILTELGRESPRKSLSPLALARLEEHSWPGNVRELQHVLERAVILAGEAPVIGAADVRYRTRVREPGTGR